MNKLFTYLITILILTAISSNAQSIRGKIIDEHNSDVLVGATVKIEGTNKGTITDLTGTYLIENLEPGIYDIRISYIGYSDKIIKSVSLKENETVRLDASLLLADITTEEIVVEASITLSNEKALLVEQKNSDKVTDGISEQQIKRAPDASASEVLKRVIGVNIVNDKFVFIRGTSDRYSLTTLNGVQLPSTETDKKSFSFDIFPSNLIENIIITKSYTPDQPGNYSGGLVQVNTKDFPDGLTLNYNTSLVFNENSTNKDFRTYSANQNKLLFFYTGRDDGGRLLPSNIPDNRMTNSNYTQEELTEFSKSFRNNWGQSTRKAPFNTNLQLSLGNNFNLFNNPLGVFIAYSYRTGFSNTDMTRTQYNIDLSTLEDIGGRNSEFAVLNGGIMNLNYKIGDYNKIGWKTTYSINSEDITSFLEGTRKYTSEENKDFKMYETKFTERQLFSTIISGDHFIKELLKATIDWKVSYSEAVRTEPDIKTMSYERTAGTDDPFNARLGSVADADGGGRFFSDLKDINRSVMLNFTTPFIRLKDKNTKIKLGLYGNTTSRNFNARNFAPRNAGGSGYLLFLPLETIFSPENIGTSKILYEELTRESDKYRASEENFAGYLMFDIPYEKFRLITGLRYEYNRQQVNTLGIINEPITADLKNLNLLPSVNIIYSLTDKINIRTSASQTVSRPELREIAPFGFIDFITGVKISGNPDLKQSLVQNYDLRFEMYPEAGEIISASLFYKNFSSPIEEIYSPGQNNPERTFDNAKNGAVNYGIEFEVRKNLGFIDRFLSNFSFNANLTILNSEINLEGLQSISTGKTRRMQGQSPYTINFGLFYDNYDIGTSINFLYNKFGRRISEVGYNGYADIEEEGNDIIDFSASKKIFENFEIKFSVKDILNQEKRYYQKTGNEDKIVRTYNSGTRYTITAGYKF
ncbi:MAG: TonB-dependent receptor [Ignavibacteria bacterium]|nr:TonB-dependent receptor [Ignavibacteria bacterium]